MLTDPPVAIASPARANSSSTVSNRRSAFGVPRGLPFATRTTVGGGSGMNAWYSTL